MLYENWCIYIIYFIFSEKPVIWPKFQNIMNKSSDTILSWNILRSQFATYYSKVIIGFTYWKQIFKYSMKSFNLVLPMLYDYIKTIWLYLDLCLWNTLLSHQIFMNINNLWLWKFTFVYAKLWCYPYQNQDQCYFHKIILFTISLNSPHCEIIFCFLGFFFLAQNLSKCKLRLNFYLNMLHFVSYLTSPLAVFLFLLFRKVLLLKLKNSLFLPSHSFIL